MSKREQKPESVKQQGTRDAGAYLARTAKQVSPDTRSAMKLGHKFQLMKATRS
jgi:hypothetical protein